MTGRILLLVVFGVAAIAAPSLADDSRPLIRQIVLMWLPLVLIIGLWIFFIRRMAAGKQRGLIEGSVPRMDAIERKLDRIIELLERPAKR